MATSNPVAELVENPLSVPFSDFIRIFTADLEPILLSQPGLLSVMTGFVLSDAGTDRGIAVSLTQWESLAAHAAFLASPSAEPFFQRVQPLTTGPPTIQHFELGRLGAQAIGSSYACIAKSDSHSDVSGHRSLRAIVDQHAKAHGQAAAAEGPCVEDAARRAAVLFGNHTVSQVAANINTNSDSDLVAYTVSWQRNSVKRKPQSL